MLNKFLVSSSKALSKASMLTLNQLVQLTIAAGTSCGTWGPRKSELRISFAKGSPYLPLLFLDLTPSSVNLQVQ